MTPHVLHLREVAKMKRKKGSSFKCASAREAIKEEIAILILMNAMLKVHAKTMVPAKMLKVLLPVIAKTLRIKGTIANNLNTVSVVFPDLNFKNRTKNFELFSLDLVKVTLLNGVHHRCAGKTISVAIHGKSTGGYNKTCSSEVKPQIFANTTSIWNTQDLGTKCKKILFDPNKGLELAVRTDDPFNPFCPNKVQLEILDIDSKEPRFFCSKINSEGNWQSDNWDKYPAFEERCFSD